MKIEKLHNFHDQQFSEEWSDKFEPTAERRSLFEMITNQLQESADGQLNILELGIGPGYLAAHILARKENSIYEGLDFSEAMLSIAAKRLQSYEDNIFYTKADLTNSAWKDQVKTKPQNIISTWALHDLLSKENIFKVYKSAFELLPRDAKLINGDFIKPEESIFEYEQGRIKPSEHLELLRLCGFRKVECLKIFEENKDEPTTANNYACFVAIK